MMGKPQPSESDLAAYADRALPAKRMAEVRAEIDASPELAKAVADQQWVASTLRAIDTPAPDAVRQRLGDLVDGTHSRPSRPGRWILPVGAAAGAAAVAAAAVIALTSSGSAGPTVGQTARLALASPNSGAPAEDRPHHRLVMAEVDGLAFPYWGDTLGWQAAGARTDGLRGRTIVTVAYRSAHGARVGYSIVAGAPLPASGGRVVERAGVRFRLLQEGQLRVITWQRGGHTCVIAGRSVDDRTLLSLASGRPDRSLPA